MKKFVFLYAILLAFGGIFFSETELISTNGTEPHVIENDIY